MEINKEKKIIDTGKEENLIKLIEKTKKENLNLKIMNEFKEI